MSHLCDFIKKLLVTSLKERIHSLFRSLMVVFLELGMRIMPLRLQLKQKTTIFAQWMNLWKAMA